MRGIIEKSNCHQLFYIKEGCTLIVLLKRQLMKIVLACQFVYLYKEVKKLLLLLQDFATVTIFCKYKAVGELHGQDTAL